MGSEQKEFADILGRTNWWLVIGCALCQTWCMLCVAIPSPVTYESVSPDLRWLSALTTAVVTVPLVIRPTRTAVWLSKPAFIIAIGLIATCGSLLGPVSALWASRQVVIYVAAILVGVGFSCLFLIWYQNFCLRRDMVGLASSILICNLLTYPLAMLLYGGLVNLWAASAIACALPVLSVGLLMAGDRRAEIAAPEHSKTAVDKTSLLTLLRFCLSLLVVIATVETARNLLLGNGALSFYSGPVNLSVLICKLVLFVPLILPFLHRDAVWVSRVYRLAFILLLAVVLTLPYLVRGNDPAHGLLDMGSFFYEMVIMLVAYQMSIGSRLDPVLVFGSSRIVWASGVILGIMVSGVCRGQGGEVVGVLSVVLSIATAVAFCFLFTDWDCVMILAELPGSSNRARFRTKCLNLAGRCGLSERECDVMLLVAKGRSAARIAKDMSISLATANSHIHHIYQKTGVHSRQELLDAIEEEQDS